MIKDSNPRLF